MILKMIVTIIFLALTVKACIIGNINHGDPHEVVRTYLEYCACLLKSINQHQFETKMLIHQLVARHVTYDSMDFNPLSRSSDNENMYDQSQTRFTPIKTQPVILFPMRSSNNQDQRKK